MVLGTKHKCMDTVGTYQASALPKELLSPKFYNSTLLHAAPRRRRSCVADGGRVPAVFLFVSLSFSISKCRNLKVLNIFSNGLTS